MINAHANAGFTSLFLLLVAAGQACADPITLNFTGQVTEFETFDFSPPDGETISVGDRVVFSARYNPSAARVDDSQEDSFGLISYNFPTFPDGIPVSELPRLSLTINDLVWDYQYPEMTGSFASVSNDYIFPDFSNPGLLLSPRDRLFFSYTAPPPLSRTGPGPRPTWFVENAFPSAQLSIDDRNVDEGSPILLSSNELPDSLDDINPVNSTITGGVSSLWVRPDGPPVTVYDEFGVPRIEQPVLQTGYSIAFALEPSSLTFEPLIDGPRPPPSEAKIFIHLDVENDVPAGFELREWFDLRPTSMAVIDGGTHPVADVSGYNLEDLRSRVQGIFNDSQMADIEVVTDTSKIPVGAQVYTVFFGQAELGFLKGIAFDTTSSGRGIDLFDRREGGKVVVFPIFTSRATASGQADLAETIAHEVGHGLGLKHTVAPTSGVDVMTTPEIEYEDGEKFSSLPLRMNNSLNTQNAQFTVRFFSLDEPLEHLLEVYEPGGLEKSYLERTLEYRTIRLGLDRTSEYFLASSEGASGGVYLSALEDFFDEDGFLTLDFFDFSVFSIVGASTKGGAIDLVVGKATADAFATELLGSDFSSGNFFLLDYSSGGGFVSSQIKVATKSRSYFSPAAVPVPAPGFLLGLSLPLLLASRRILGNSRKRNLNDQ